MFWFSIFTYLSKYRLLCHQCGKPKPKTQTYNFSPRARITHTSWPVWCHMWMNPRVDKLWPLSCIRKKNYEKCKTWILPFCRWKSTVRWNILSCFWPWTHKYGLLVKLVLSRIEAYHLCHIQREMPLPPSMPYGLTCCMGLEARKPKSWLSALLQPPGWFVNCFPFSEVHMMRGWGWYSLWGECVLKSVTGEFCVRLLTWHYGWLFWHCWR